MTIDFTLLTNIFESCMGLEQILPRVASRLLGGFAHVRTPRDSHREGNKQNQITDEDGARYNLQLALSRLVCLSLELLDLNFQRNEGSVRLFVFHHPNPM